MTRDYMPLMNWVNLKTIAAITIILCNSAIAKQREVKITSFVCDDKRSRLWGRLNWSSKEATFLVSDQHILHGSIQPYMPLTLYTTPDLLELDSPGDIHQIEGLKLTLGSTKQETKMVLKINKLDDVYEENRRPLWPCFRPLFERCPKRRSNISSAFGELSISSNENGYRGGKLNYTDCHIYFSPWVILEEVLFEGRWRESQWWWN
jgi:hypothetical protein